jgi:hypothetical protein
MDLLITFGPLVRRVVRERLGLSIPAVAFGSWEALEEEAGRVLGRWGDWHHRASARVARLGLDTAAPELWFHRASLLVEDIYHAGLRAWLRQVLEAATPISTPTDLRRWCSLLVRAREVAEDAYPVPIWSGPRWSDYEDGELLGTVEPMLWAEDGTKVYKALGELSCIRAEGEGWDWIRYLQESHDVGGGTPLPDTPDPQFWESLARQAWQHLRRLSPGDTGFAAEAPKEMTECSDWRGVLHQVMTWCRQQGGEPADRAAGPETSRQAKQAGKNAPPERSWTQGDLDDEIVRYKARITEYRELVRGVEAGRPEAKKAAQKLFGRNVLAKKLGVKAKAMVSRSPAWRKIAKELQLPRKGNLGTGRPRKVGFEIAAEDKAEAQTGAVVDEVARRETINLVRRRLDPQAAEATIEKLERGEMTDEQAREMAEMLGRP